MEESTNTNASANQGSIPSNGNGQSNSRNGNKNHIDEDGNEITRSGKIWAGSLLILITLSSALYLIGHWPDRLVRPKDHIQPLYVYKWFHVQLAGIPDTGNVKYVNDSVVFTEGPGYVYADNRKTDYITIPPYLKDSAKIDSITKENDKIRASLANKISGQLSEKKFKASELLHINTLLLILVAVAGFLGNMIHISASFTNFLGNGEFKKRWTLFYVVKPFTAAALAITIYFVFRGGFLNMSDDSTNINIYGLMTISILAGLFTDRTTLKLREVFEVLLKPKEERADPLIDNKPQVISVNAPPLELGKAVTITINGKNLDKQPITIKINDQEVTDLIIQPSLISFNYTLLPELKDKDALLLDINNEAGKMYPTQTLPIKKDGTLQY